MGQLAKDFPACPEFRRHHASGHITLGNFYLNDKRRPEAEEALSKGVKLWETMVAEFPQEKECANRWPNPSINWSAFTSLPT